MCHVNLGYLTANDRAQSGANAMTIEVTEFDESSEDMIPKPKSLIFLGTGTSGTSVSPLF